MASELEVKQTSSKYELSRMYIDETNLRIGAHRLVEEHLKRPLSHFNCLNHAAERPARHSDLKFRIPFRNYWVNWGLFYSSLRVIINKK